MRYEANSPKEYIDQLPEDRQAAIKELRKIIKKNLPNGFKEEMSYGMIGYVVPHSLFPNGYHVDPRLPLPFMAIASQKNFIAVYSSSLYADKKTLGWFTKEFPKHSKLKLDMGKSCIRFKKPDQIPFDLIGVLASKMTVKEWISIYEKNLKK